VTEKTDKSLLIINTKLSKKIRLKFALFDLGVY